MRATATTEAPATTGADTIAVGVFDGEGVAHDLSGGELGALLASGEARTAFRRLAVTHAGGLRWIVAGLGARERFDAERARVAAAVVLGRARELGARRLCWELPHHVGDEVAGALVEGTALADYRFELFRSGADDEDPGARLEELIVSAHHDVAGAVERGLTLATAQNRARDLQNRPANDLTPAALADCAAGIAERLPAIGVTITDGAGLRERGMGAFAAVAQGSSEDPRMIELRYEPPEARGPRLALVGKAVTFDSGGISIKPSAGMQGMKFDMSGGAAVIEATAAAAELGLPVRIHAVVGATENLPGGRAVKPGDIVRAMNGKTIEVNNTDAEGRLVLSDCLAHAVQEGAERIVDIATLTGAVVVALGSTYAGLMGDDDQWCATVEDAGRATGELVWRLPLHEEYAELVKGRYADLQNVAEQRKAGTIVGAQFLRHFTGEVPWAHVDMAGVDSDLGRAYARKGGSGWGVRLLAEVAARTGELG